MKAYILIKDSFIVGLLKVFSIALTSIISILLARSLSIYEYGMYSFIMNLVLWSSMFVVFGFDALLAREVAKYAAKSNFGEVFSILISTFVLMIVLWFSVSLGIFFLKNFLLIELPFRLLLYSIILLAGQSLLDFESGLLLGLDMVFVSQFIRYILPWIIMISFLFYLSDISIGLVLKLQSMGFLVVSLFTLLALIGWFRSYELSYDLLINVRKLKDLLFGASPFASIKVLSSSITFIPVLLLKIFGKYDDIALFDVAVKVSVLITFALSSVNFVITPKVVALYQSQKYHDLKMLVSRAALISSIFALVTFVGILVFGKMALYFVWGKGFERSFNSLVILALSEVVNAFSGPVAMLLNMTDNEKIVLKIMVLCMIFSVIAGLLFVPHFELEGAAAVKAATTVLWNLSLVYYVSTVLKINPTAFSRALFKRG